MSEEEQLDKKLQLGQIIKKNREMMELSRGRLAHLTKIQKKYISKVENGRAYIRRGMLNRIAEYLLFTKQERQIFFSIIEQFCSMRGYDDMKGVHRNFSQRKKEYPRKRPGTPIDIRLMKINCYKIS